MKTITSPLTGRTYEVPVEEAQPEERVFYRSTIMMHPCGFNRGPIKVKLHLRSPDGAR